MSEGQVTTIRELIDRSAASRPDVDFLISPESGLKVTFRALRERSILLSRHLLRAGLERGDKVAFLLDNGLFTAQLFLGAMYGGFVSVPLNVRAGVSQLSYTLNHCDAKVVFVGEEYRGLLNEALADVPRTIQAIPADSDWFEFDSKAALEAEILPPPQADDLALLMYTSGSTGQPKAAVHSHRTILAHGKNSICSHQLTSEDRSLLVLPLYHINAECTTLIPTLLSGGSVVVPRRFIVSKFWDWLDERRCTWSAVVPTIVSQLLDWEDPRAGQREAAFERIRFLRSSSAPLSPALQRKFLDKFKLLLIQGMGSSETGKIFSNPLPPGKNKIGTPGLPQGFDTRIVNREGCDVSAGEPGEILVRGEAVMQGYYKDPEATAAVLDADGWLHTGDLAYQDEDGYFFVVGRSKELIIKGGMNIAPRQIDEVLESHPSVLEAAVVGIPDHYFGEDLIAFVVPRAGAGVGERELLTLCENRLGHFKTPTRIHFAGDLPKGPSGKVQRLRLLDRVGQLAGARPAQGNGHYAHDALPNSTLSIEQAIAGSWAELLGRRQIDPDTNFFSLGGHSLLAMQCISQLRDKIPVPLSLSDFFENGTVSQLAALVRRRLQTDDWRESQGSTDHRMGPSVIRPAIPPRDPALPCPLSPEQRGLWFLEQLNPGVPVYNQAEAVRLVGELNTDALERALNAIVARHEVLRATIQATGDEPIVVVHEDWPLQLNRIDLSALAPAERQGEVERLLVEEPRRLYHLETEPGIHATLLRLAPREHVFILMMHHIICDRSSFGIFWREVAALYRAFCRGEAVVLPPLPIQYGDYVVWQQQQITGSESDEDLSFWTENLRGAPPLLDLPADRPRPATLSHRGAKRWFRLNPTLTKTLRDFAQREKTTLFALFTAALNTLFYCYTEKEDILLGIPIANRERPELQGVIGLLVHTHVLRTRLSKNMTFRELLARVRKGVLDVYRHRAARLDQVVRKIQPKRSRSYSPLFQVVINWRDRDLRLSFIGLEGLKVEPLLAESRTSKFDLRLSVTDGGNEIQLEMEYSTDLFDDARIVRMIRDYQTLLESVASDPSQRLSELPIGGAEALETNPGQAVRDLSMLPSAERHRLFHQWNDTKTSYPREKCVHQLFEEQVARTPDAVAVVFEGESLSYCELNTRANRLAHYLRELGVKPDARVAICQERSLEMVVAILAVLKAGGAYVPLDPSYPVERLRFMLEDSAPLALLACGRLVARLAESNRALPVLDMANPAPAWGDRPVSDPNPNAVGLRSHHLAYIMYTSGSTGNPKGVMIEHRSLVNQIVWRQQAYAFDAHDVVLQKTPFTFDVSLWEFFVPLLLGSRLVMARPDGHKDPAYLYETVRRNNVTALHFVPSMLQAFLGHADGAACPSLVQVLSSGEALPASLVRRFCERFPGVALHNLYGPTEATVDVTSWSCPSDVPTVIPIGRPVANTQIYVLDRDMQPVPVGVAGELYIGGDCLARGYLNRPELTAEKFIPDPFHEEPGARLYKTGDLGRYLPDGNIEFLGRNDFQVKIRGFRVELGEIEARLAGHAGVREAVVVAREDAPGNKRLVAYYVATGEQETPATEELRSYLAAALPEYMVPAGYVRLERLPATPNGKLDRKALPAPEMDAYARGYEEPQGEMERRIAALWAEVLKLDRVGRHDNFFELGGHSLLAVRLVNEIEKSLNWKVPLPVFVQNPTIEALANLLQKEDHATRQPRLIQLQPGRSAGAIFFISATLAECRLAQRLAIDLAAFATAVPLPEEVVQIAVSGEHVDGPTVEELAQAHAELICSREPSDPCLLVGYSFHGKLAFEVARQLMASGRDVDAVLLLDSWAIIPSFWQKLRVLSAARVAKWVKFRASQWLWHKKSAALSSWEQGGKLPWEVPWEILSKIYENARRRYRLRPLETRGILFRARNSERAHYHAIVDDLGWRTLFPRGFEIVEISGGHLSLLSEPNLPELSQRFNECLERVAQPEKPYGRQEGELALQASSRR